MNEVNESLKSGYLSQKSYYIEAFKIFKEMFKKDKKYIPSIIVLYTLGGYMTRGIFIQRLHSTGEKSAAILPLYVILINVLIIIVSEYALNLFENDVIGKVDGKNEMDRKDVLLKSVLLAVVMVFINNLLSVIAGFVVLVYVALMYSFPYFRQTYLSRNLNISESVEKNSRLAQGNRARFITPIVITYVLSTVVLAVFYNIAAAIGKSESPKAVTAAIVVFIVYNIFIGIIKIYNRILESVIFLNVENMAVLF